MIRDAFAVLREARLEFGSQALVLDALACVAGVLVMVSCAWLVTP